MCLDRTKLEYWEEPTILNTLGAFNVLLSSVRRCHRRRRQRLTRRPNRSRCCHRAISNTHERRIGCRHSSQIRLNVRRRINRPYSTSRTPSYVYALARRFTVLSCLAANAAASGLTQRVVACSWRLLGGRGTAVGRHGGNLPGRGANDDLGVYLCASVGHDVGGDGAEVRRCSVS